MLNRFLGWGVVSGAVIGALHLVMPDKIFIEISAILLTVVGTMYLGFAVQAGTRLSRLLVEILGAIVFCGIAVLALTSSFWWLVVGYMLHAVWDWMHHTAWGRANAGPSKDWYPPLCIGFDITVAFILIWRLLFWG